MHALIIGCGYLGKRVAQLFLGQGAMVTALTRSPQRARELEQCGIRTVVGDVLNPPSLQALPTADLCVYAVGYDRTAPFDKRTVYVDGLSNVIREIQPRIPHLIYVSSTSVYGQNRGESVDEFSETNPIESGGSICLEAEELVRRSYPPESDSLNAPAAVILRLAGIYGPGRLIGRREQLEQQAPIQANPDGWLNLIHVDDAAQAIQMLAAEVSQRGHFPAPLYLLSDGKPVLRRDFYGAMAELIGAPAPIFACSDPQALNKRCISRRILTDLKWSLKHPDSITALRTLLAPAD